MSKLRLGMIGAGAWCVASHLPRLEQHRDSVEFAAVNRRDPVLLETVRSKFGFASAHTDYRGVLEAEPDIVVVASPVRWHHEHAKAALEAGAHVLVEKPFTVHPDEARDLVAPRPPTTVTCSSRWAGTTRTSSSGPSGSWRPAAASARSRASRS